MNQFKTTDQYLRDQDKQVNIAIGASVDQINNYAKQIASLNDQISRLTGVGAGRHLTICWINAIQLVSELNQIVGVEVSVQDGGTYNITMANGYSLVQEVRRGNWRQFLPALTLLVRLSLMLMDGRQY
ncbi:flagellar hook-associated protein 1 [Escherichia coli]|nr:flagellar hook-associated protein 1 [Escherichia coli]